MLMDLLKQKSLYDDDSEMNTPAFRGSIQHDQTLGMSKSKSTIRSVASQKSTIVLIQAIYK